MSRKIIDVYRLQNLNDLFGIKLIFYDPWREGKFTNFQNSSQMRAGTSGRHDPPLCRHAEMWLCNS